PDQSYLKRCVSPQCSLLSSPPFSWAPLLRAQFLQPRRTTPSLKLLKGLSGPALPSRLRWNGERLTSRVSTWIMSILLLEASKRSQKGWSTWLGNSSLAPPTQASPTPKTPHASRATAVLASSMRPACSTRTRTPTPTWDGLVSQRGPPTPKRTTPTPRLTSTPTLNSLLPRMRNKLCNFLIAVAGLTTLR
ncbi:hypothetical protein M407DRAFT_212375, partial [Tulasnella calospora MUT 4182]